MEPAEVVGVRESMGQLAVNIGKCVQGRGDAGTYEKELLFACDRSLRATAGAVPRWAQFYSAVSVIGLTG